MQLTKIKLAGFKSFVDPTQVLLPSNLVAVVGPNGCGKSNIIDAVCWVMGESSAKYLRGESLTDVIFNGSSARKPVGQATVELIFDNQDGSFAGEYSTYSEISIRRQITRESESSYFLNGTRCRRKDITDIFLGTGLGPRSYSIIGQNMISRIIEAKPDDMRVYLEEAAGVSKYKERRRETENRINHTKENIARLTDLRMELEKQLASLKRQASAAEKFKTLKEEERTIRSQWLAIQWRELDSQLVQFSLQIQQQETGLEARQAEIVNINLTLEEKREDKHKASENFQEVQRRFYGVGNEITRMEQDIHHAEQRQRQRQADYDQLERDIQQESEHLTQSKEELVEIQREMAQLEPQIKDADRIINELEDKFNAADEDMQNWQQQWDEFNQTKAELSQSFEVHQTKARHLEQQIQAAEQRKNKLQHELLQFNVDDLNQDIETLTHQLSEINTQEKQQSEELNQTRINIQEQQVNLQNFSKQLDIHRSQLQQLRGKQASLDALQKTALGQSNKRTIQWLEKYALHDKPRLAQEISVESGWEHAVEKVLGSYLQAVCVDHLDQAHPLINDIPEGNLNLFAPNQQAAERVYPTVSLLSKVHSRYPLEAILSNIVVAETTAEALTLSATLQPHESVITKDGLWLSANWIRISRDESPEEGVFQREQELKLLAEQITEHEQQITELDANIIDCKQEINHLESLRDELQTATNQYHAKHAELHAQQNAKKEKVEELMQRSEQCQQEFEECANHLQSMTEELEAVRQITVEARQALDAKNEERHSLEKEKELLREKLQTLREQLDESREQAHEHEIQWQTAKSQQASLQQTIVRMETQLVQLTERKSTLQEELNSTSQLDELKKSLSLALTQRLEIETELNQVRSVAEAIEQEYRTLENNRHEIEQESAKVRDHLESLRIDSQGLKVKNENVLSQLTETGCVLEEIIQQLTPEMSAEEWHSQLEQITQRITRLGPINLVAIEEYSVCSERKEYLDKQYNDLQEGLNTLENAIAKIDKESRTKFKETFDKVNENFQNLFPTIFGGGKAYLELTGESLLDAGITVMACPPGKRNSTIHLLSGGEKAMTAISLIFSIFQLNPAPFCLLDEVDAPLDDANIGRFCQLVKNMSDKTQFIFISHNKLAIEMAQHLMGVTMHEPGVSRLVSVNIEEAVSLAGA